jgi:flagellar biosynthesis protein FliP
MIRDLRLTHMYEILVEVTANINIVIWLIFSSLFVVLLTSFTYIIQTYVILIGAYATRGFFSQLSVIISLTNI